MLLRLRLLVGLIAACLFGSVLIALPQAPSPSVALTATPTRPNIVVVMTDDMRADDVMFAPGIQQLVANQGLTMSNAFSPYPLCCPARASFLTGQHAHNHKVLWHLAPYGYRSFDDSRTLATSLSAVGYHTGFIGKYMNGYGQHRSKVSGKPSWRYVPRGWTDWRAAIKDPGNRRFSGDTYNYRNTPFNVNGKIDNSHRGKFQTHVIGNFSVQMAQRFSRSARPFFMAVNYVAPHHGSPSEKHDPRPLRGTQFHTPWVAPEYRGVFDSLIKHASGVPRKGAPVPPGYSPELTRRPDLGRMVRKRLREVTRQRAESIYAVDLQVMRLVRTLKKAGEWDNTVLVFTSDNGYFLGESRRMIGKTSSFESTIRIPMLITGPGMRGTDSNGHTRHDPITLLDLGTTIVELAGARPPRVPDGTSRLTTLLHGDQGWTTPVLLENTHTARRKVAWFKDPRTGIGIRTSRWSLTRYRDGRNQLFDLVTDPLQKHNVWGQPDAREARDALLEVWSRTKDCTGSACLPELPPNLTADASQNAAWTNKYWATINDVFGQY